MELVGNKFKKFFYLFRKEGKFFSVATAFWDATGRQTVTAATATATAATAAAAAGQLTYTSEFVRKKETELFLRQKKAWSCTQH